TAIRYPNPEGGPPQHRPFAIEYYCPTCKPQHVGRFFKKPDQADLERLDKADAAYKKIRPEFVPQDEIPDGDETARLHRWGYAKYRDMFNTRQLLALELSARLIARQPDERVRNALATNLSDLLRYQNMLCRYDTAALKSLDIFSVHGFPVGLIQCESNFLGIPNGGEGCNIGSGGWSNIIDKYAKAKTYCDSPYETRRVGKRKIRVPIHGEWIGDNTGNGRSGQNHNVALFCSSAADASIKPASLDGVFTDPPYFGNVQYAELMDFCYVWLRRLIGKREPAFTAASTRHPDELTGNESMGRGLEHFTEGLSAVFSKMARALKPGAPLAFTYHHNLLDAYAPVAVAILDAGLVCSASLPCPAEMAASIHISGTGSSIVDTILVCRSSGHVPKRWLVDSSEGLADLVQADLLQLREGGVRPTKGDMRCVLFGHLTRLAIWQLRTSWAPEAPTAERLGVVLDWMRTDFAPDEAQSVLSKRSADEPALQVAEVREKREDYGEQCDVVSF
ncbi:MAG: DNA methylase, partial [Planctomycetes bacterium]|nr:DNA methylase [Planctomycetota bacterium]